MLITEGKATIDVPNAAKVSKDMPVFYNKAMKQNRDISISLLNTRGPMQIADPFGGTGIRSIRFSKELKSFKIIAANDKSQEAVSLMRKNCKLNKVSIPVSCEDANIFLLKSCGFDYIDIDPFGYPGRFLSAAAERISRQGILAVTATDTAALSGTFPDACIRKYWATPLRGECMHEIGLRILIRQCQMIAGQFEKSLIPLASYSSLHYMRTFLLVEKHARSIKPNFGMFGYCPKCLFRGATDKKECPNCGAKLSLAGPLWLGKLGDKATLQKMDEPLARQLAAETDDIGFYNLHRVCEAYHKDIPKMEVLMKNLRSAGFSASRTHFTPLGIKTDAPIKDFVKLIR